MIDTLGRLAALGWVGWVWLTVARPLRRGTPISPPLFASANLFALGVLRLLGIGASPLHLLWWFPSVPCSVYCCWRDRFGSGSIGAV